METLREEESHKEPTPSTSGLSSYRKRRREEYDEEQPFAQKLRRSYEESSRGEESSTELTPSTSGLSSSTYRSKKRYWETIPKRPWWVDDSDSD